MSRPEAAADTATVLFTDVEGSTDLRTRLGDARAQAILTELDRRVREQVEAHAGEVVKSLGDGVMASFISARSAVLAAMAIQEGGEDAPRIRIGINHGEVVREGDDLQGTAVHAAARIAAAAHGGQILVSETVAELAGLLPEGSRLVDRGLFWLKGFPERWRLHEVIGGEEGADPGAAAGRTEYVGRDEELADLRRALAAADGGRGGIVLVGGEPGVGKTRLAEEIVALARRRGMLAFTGRCSDIEGAPPYLPFVEIFEASALIPKQALLAASAKTAGDIARVMPSPRRDAAGSGRPPLELPPERRAATCSTRRRVRRASGPAALEVLVLDDLHWADESTLWLLEHLARLLPELPCLVIGPIATWNSGSGRPLARTQAVLSSAARGSAAARSPR